MFVEEKQDYAGEAPAREAPWRSSSLATTLTLVPRRKFRSSILLPGVDILTMMAAFWLGGLVNFSYQNWSFERTCILAALSAACLAAFHQLGHYSRRRPFWQEVGDVIIVALLALVADAALLYLLKVNFSRVWVLTSWVSVIAAVPLVRAAAKQLSARLGAWRQPTVVVGTGRNALEAALAFACDNHIGFPNHLGYEIVAFIDPSGRADGPVRLAVAGHSVPVEPIDADAQSLPGWLGRPHVIVALELDEMASRESFIENLSLRYGDIDVVTPLRGLPINRARVTHFFSQDFVSFRIYNNLARPWSQALKRAFDIVIGAVLLAGAAPLMAVIAWQVAKSGGRCSSRTSAIGRHGQLFRCWKFRTMVPGAEAVLADLLAKDQAARAEWDRDFKLQERPAGHADRPLAAPDQLRRAAAAVQRAAGRDEPRRPAPGGARRAAPTTATPQVYYAQVRPGLTGLWQVSGRNDVDYARRIHLDAGTSGIGTSGMTSSSWRGRFWPCSIAAAPIKGLRPAAPTRRLGSVARREISTLRCCASPSSASAMSAPPPPPVSPTDGHHVLGIDINPGEGRRIGRGARRCRAQRRRALAGRVRRRAAARAAALDGELDGWTW